ncbi:MAG: M23 family metallopeptidase [Clostridiales bacterium]|nr:M23 family metallopeptidase [Clostridiales bacterium]
MLVNLFSIYQATSSSNYKDTPVNLSFPLKNGTYMICFGGDGDKSALMNYHYKFPLYERSAKDPSVRFAVDLVGLNSLGRSSFGFLPLDTSHYVIFNNPVYSPCEGVVVKTDTGWDDETPFSYNFPYNPGNSITIRYGNVNSADEIYVFLGHLEKGSILVKPGDKVIKGELLGRVGNSGWTTEPHLHIQAMKAPDANGADGEGIPILFDGKPPLKNSLFIR